MVRRRHRNRHHRPSPPFRHFGEAELFHQYALDMRGRAYSHRGYLVGGSGVGITAEGTYVRLSGYNTKAAEGPRRKGDKCAEMRLIDDAKEKKCVAILEMWYALEPQADDKTGLDLGVTISCVHCRARFKSELKNPGSPLKRDTRVNFIDCTNPQRWRPFAVEQILRICS